MEPIISLSQVSKSFSRRCVLSGVSLNIEKGSVIGIVGDKGSGKTVLLNIICGFIIPDSGQVCVRGCSLGKGRRVPENMGVLINSPGFSGLNSGLQNLRYLAGIRGVVGDKEIRAAMQKAGLDPEDKTRVAHYSQGMKQKLGIAQAIMENQDILILDEPFNAVDYKTYNDTKEIVRLLQAEGRTILMTSCNYDDLTPLCNHIYAINEGKMDSFIQ